ncbi:MAG TPA: hypothetical protein VJK03_05375 [Candidatus Nanoarchaeia archaeon]|nr:hypothetical protein [Candidatus Nanoarchaeia archaeon]
MARINKIHFLVFPVWRGKTDENKKKRWLINLKYLARAEDTLFVMVKVPKQRDSLLPVEKELIEAGKPLGKRFIYSNDYGRILDSINTHHTFAKEVEIIAYGQHGGSCVAEECKWLKEILKRKFSNVLFKSREQLSYSPKLTHVFFGDLVRRKKPQLLKNMTEGEVDTAMFAYLRTKGRRIDWFKKALREAKTKKDFFRRLRFPPRRL